MLRLSRWIEFSATSLLHLQVGDDKIFRGDSYIAANRHRISALNPPSQLVIPKKHAKKYDADLGGFFFWVVILLSTLCFTLRSSITTAYGG